ncbi:MAG: hypothetical protein K2H09_01025, partial [Treponemataceae bacterium]|nr:hypothetical protein [Treponemataceae bacterium]
EIKYVGDSIADSIPILQERQDYDALEIIEAYRKKPGLDFFNDSKKRLLEYVGSRSPYPEADFLAGYIYQLEGEYDVAERCYLKALESADVLDIPDEKYDILYALAEISLIRQDFSQYEKYLLNIVAQDNAFKDKGLIAAMNRTIRSRSADCLEKFFLLYRADNFRLLNAYFKLSDWYRKENAAERALDASALGALTGFTKIFTIVRTRNPEFQYEGFESLLDAAAAYPDVVEWGVDNNLWKGFYLFAEQAEKTGSTVFAEKLYTAILNHSPETYWREAAEARLEAFKS